jgi:hypothetical protein
VLGSYVPSIPAVDTAGVASRCCTVPANCSPAGVATVWRMRANMKPCTIAASGRHRKYECNWGEPEEFPDRPKGMHWRTYERQRDTHDAAAARSMVGLTQFINRLQRRARVRTATGTQQGEEAPRPFRSYGRAAVSPCGHWGIPAARGGKWSAVQVARLREAAAVPFDGASVALA